MADITNGNVTPLPPTQAEKDAIAAMKLPRFVDRKNVVVVKDEETGERIFVIQQELPAFLRRNKVKRYSVQSADRKVMRHEWRDVNRRAKSLANRIRVEEDDVIEVPGPQGQKMFFRAIRRGWFHARYFDVPAYENGQKVTKRKLVIDQGPGAAQIEPDLELYEGFREV